MEPLKPFKSYVEQVSHLKTTHGLIINDDEKAIEVLSRINYYRLSAYGISLRDPANKEIYRPGTTFNQIVSLYNFDAALRTYLFLPISEIEIQFRTKVAYRLGEHYGPEGYMNPSNFSSETNPNTGILRHSELMQKLNEEIDRQITLPCVKHHIDKYGGHFPIWAAIELMSFGSVLSLFTIMLPEDRKAISKEYGIDYARLKSWLLSLVEVRNICAHSNRLYNMPLKQSPRLYSEYVIYSGTNKIFPLILVLKRLLDGSQLWNDLVNSLAGIISSTPEIDIKCLGFPPDWKRVLGVS